MMLAESRVNLYEFSVQMVWPGSLLDAGLLVRQGDHWRATEEIESIAVPDTLTGVITARLDRLVDDS